MLPRGVLSVFVRIKKGMTVRIYCPAVCTYEEQTREAGVITNSSNRATQSSSSRSRSTLYTHVHTIPICSAEKNMIVAHYWYVANKTGNKKTGPRTLSTCILGSETTYRLIQAYNPKFLQSPMSTPFWRDKTLKFCTLV